MGYLNRSPDALLANGTGSRAAARVSFWYVNYSRVQDGWPIDGQVRKALTYVVAKGRAEWDEARAERQRREDEARRAAGLLVPLPTLTLTSSLLPTTRHIPPLYCRDLGWVVANEKHADGWSLTPTGLDIAEKVVAFADDRHARQFFAHDAIVAWANATPNDRLNLDLFWGLRGLGPGPDLGNDLSWFWTEQFSRDEINLAVWWATAVGHLAAETTTTGRRRHTHSWTTINVTPKGTDYVKERVGRFTSPTPEQVHSFERGQPPPDGRFVATGDKIFIIHGDVSGSVFGDGHVFNNWGQADPLIAQLVKRLDVLSQQTSHAFADLASGIRSSRQDTNAGKMSQFLDQVIGATKTLAASKIANEVIGLATDLYRLIKHS